LGGKLMNDPVWLAAHMERVTRMLERDKNHPSIVIWSLGNESGRGPTTAAMAAWIHDFDITRPVHYEPGMGSHQLPGYIDPSDPRYPKSNDHSHRLQNSKDQYYVDMVSRFYPGIFTPELLLNQQNGDKRPILFVEYSHSMGNSTGNIKDFWDIFRAHPRLIGGFIWDYKDQALIRKDSLYGEVLAYGGDFGEKIHNGAFSLNGIVDAWNRPKAAMWENKRIYQAAEVTLLDASNAGVRIKNRSSLLNLNRYQATLLIRENGEIIREVSLPAIDVAAGDSVELSLLRHIPIKRNNGKDYQLDLQFRLKQEEAWAPKGFLVSSSQLRWQEVNGWYLTELDKPKRIDLQEQDSVYLVVGKDFTATFNKKSGALTQMRYKNEEIVNQALLPNFTRPATDNERRGWKPHVKLKYWYNAVALQHTAAQKSADSITVESNYSLPGDSAQVSIQYTVHSDGIITVNYNLQTNNALPNIPKVGMQLGVNPTFEQIQYYGLGDMENYPDRAYGFDLGVYSSTLDDFMQPYLYPQENGNRMEVRWFRLQNKKYGLLVEGKQPLQMGAWPFSQKQISQTKHWYKLKKENSITLNIDLLQMGVGGNDTWTDVSQPLEKYQIPAKDYEYSFRLKPFEVGKK